MKLETKYCGLRLTNPIVPGASPLSDDLDTIRELEDSGAPAIVLRSLFEEQIRAEQKLADRGVDRHTDSFAEAVSYLPESPGFRIGPDAYLEHLRRVEGAVHIPVIGSLNGSTRGGWLNYGKLIEDAGADALELNTYSFPTDPARDAREIESEFVDMVRDLSGKLRIPVAVKLLPSFSSLPNFANQLGAAGAKGVVLFNRLYQPDIDIENLEVQRSLRLSSPWELLLRLQWLAILSGRVSVDLAASGGVHSADDVVKSVMSGAHVAQVVSALLLNGPRHLKKMITEFETWGTEHEYESVEQMCGSMSISKVPDPRSFHRMNYIETLQSW